MADHFGRKIPIAVGCLIMILGAFLSAFTDGFGSKWLCVVLPAPGNLIFY